MRSSAHVFFLLEISVILSNLSNQCKIFHNVLSYFPNVIEKAFSFLYTLGGDNPYIVRRRWKKWQNDYDYEAKFYLESLSECI
ncbi:hypothetical protein IGI67_001830 [Enterococcus sp. AZ196]